MVSLRLLGQVILTSLSSYSSSKKQLRISMHLPGLTYGEFLYMWRMISVSSPGSGSVRSDPYGWSPERPLFCSKLLVAG